MSDILGATPIDCQQSALGSLREFESNAEIYGVDEPADHIYKVISGAVRTCKILEDGRRYIDSFYLQGDIFGFESRLKHELSCEAICLSKIQMMSRKFPDAKTHGNKIDDFDLVTITAEEMHRAQFQGSLLVKTASERVVGFILWMSAHSTEPGTFQLAMSRQDIADHLGLTIETVSRIFTQLEESQIIRRIPRRYILVRNRRALERMGT
jgi:CRP/FNR family nitrogen fixation transcriptional regulator